MARRSPAKVRGILHPSGPVVRVVVEGFHGVAVLDTGASISVVDAGLAQVSNLTSPGAVEWRGVSNTAERSVSALRTAHFQIHGGRTLYTAAMVEVPELRSSVPGLDVLALLGWDFLERCVLTCDGPAGAFELTLPGR